MLVGGLRNILASKKNNFFFIKSFSWTRSFNAPDYSHVVIGGGVIGLAVAAELSKINTNKVLLLEKNSTTGTETSARNSEVIHAGIYNPEASLKTQLCITGKNIIYNELTSEKTGVQWRRCGKWIVAQTDYEDSMNEKLYERCKRMGVQAELLSSFQAKQIEPSILVERSVLSSPTSGIIDSHSLMEYLASIIQEHDGEVVTGSEVTDLQFSAGKGYIIQAMDYFNENETSTVEISTENVVNCAGLYADKVANMLLPKHRHVKQYYARGNYFKLNSGGFPQVRRLVYPTPPRDGKSLGTHLTIDVDNQLRFGPDMEYIESPRDYIPNPKNISRACEAINKYYPYITQYDLEVSYAGIRPKLASPDDKSFHDFYIKEEDGFPGFVNLLGIESPGLTASVAIGRYVRDIYQK